MYDFGKYGSLSDYTHRLQTTQGPKQLFRGFAPGLAHEIGFYNAQAPMRMGALQNAFNALDPSNYGSISDAYSNNAYGQAAGIGRRMSNLLTNQFGNQPGVQAGAELSAMNQASSAVGQFRNQLYSPLNLSNAYSQQANLYSMPNVVSGMPSALAALGAVSQLPQPGSGSFLNTVVGLAGAAGGMGWNPF